mmetsp:Transcript_3835/g.9851  ORF Transcript_3835/g.9851 Transcript_3835/m.9851 type:complete len:248 (+) Transcript_3835:57-800(+)
MPKVDFEELTDAASDEVSALEKQLPQKLKDLQMKLLSLSEKSLAEVEQAFAAAVNPAEPATNQTLVSLISYARAEAAACISILLKIERYVTLKIPAAEDGNNFGVAVQLEFNKMLAEKRTKVKELLDKLTQYHKERTGLWKEVAVKSSVENVSSKTEVTEDETKNSEATKTVKSSTESHSETKNVAATPVPDAIASLVALDTNWYFQLCYSIEIIRDAYLCSFDCINKNRNKLERPKGEGAGGMNMF